MEAIDDATFRASYAGYAANHQRLRSELLARLPDKVQRDSRPVVRGRRLLSAVATLAAMLLVVGGIASLSTFVRNRRMALPKCGSVCRLCRACM